VRLQSRLAEAAMAREGGAARALTPNSVSESMPKWLLAKYKYSIKTDAEDSLRRFIKNQYLSSALAPRQQVLFGLY
jgi:hypothetical protein